MLRTAGFGLSMRKKTVRFAGEVGLPLQHGPLQISRRRGARLRPAALLCLGLTALCLVLVATWPAAEGPAPPLGRHQTYAGWLAGRDQAASGPDTGLVFRGQLLRYNQSAPVHERWPDDPQCQPLVIGFVHKNELPPVALVSLPGSGATWVRYLIEGATGVFTGSVHHQPELYNKGFLGELSYETDGSTIVQQTHRGPHVGDRNGDYNGDPVDFEVKAPKVILLMRNPYRALLHVRSLEAGYGDELAPSRLLGGPDWHRFVRLQLRQWLFRVQISLAISERLHLMHYEELQADTEGPMQKLLEFLEVSATAPEARRRCLKQHPDGLTKRSFDAAAAADFAFKSPETRQIVNEHIDELSDLLNEHGHSLPLEKYAMYHQENRLV